MNGSDKTTGIQRQNPDPCSVAPGLRFYLAASDQAETTFKEITDQMELVCHGAHTFCGLLTRTTATIAAHTLIRVCLASQ